MSNTSEVESLHTGQSDVSLKQDWKNLMGWFSRKGDRRFFYCQLDLIEAVFRRCDCGRVQAMGGIWAKAYLELAEFFERRQNAGKVMGEQMPNLAELYVAKSMALLLMSDAELRQTVALSHAEIEKIQDNRSLHADFVLPAPGEERLARAEGGAETPLTGDKTEVVLTPPKVPSPFEPGPWQNPILYYRAQFLVDRLYSLVKNIKEREYIRAQSAAMVLIVEFLLVGASCVCFLLGSYVTRAVHPLTWAILAFGGLGASASILQRIQKPVSDDFSVAYLLRLRHGTLSLWISVLLGSLFALMLTLILCSGFAELVFSDKIAAALPKVGGSSLAQSYYLIDFGSESAGLMNISRTLVLSFLSGFSERLVPDVLSRIETEALSARR